MIGGHDLYDGTGSLLSGLGTQRRGVRAQQLCGRDERTPGPVAAGTRDPDGGRQEGEQ